MFESRNKRTKVSKIFLLLEQNVRVKLMNVVYLNFNRKMVVCMGLAPVCNGCVRGALILRKSTPEATARVHYS